MSRFATFAIVCAALLALVAAVSASGIWGPLDLSLHGWIALGLGVVLTSAVGVGLMALVFYSDRSGRDH